MDNYMNAAILIIVSAVVTLILRAFPFLVFRKNEKMPPKVKKVVDLLPTAIMAVLVVYCIKNEVYSLIDTSIGYINLIAAAISIALLVLVHLWKRKTLVSIAVGTVLYMALIRLLPIII